MEPRPHYLYKVLSIENWNASQTAKFLKLPPEDDAFIHFSKEDQLNRIVEKFWKGVSQFALLKVETEKLLGNLVYETNPGGSQKYYHLYDGSIPLHAVVESKIVSG